MKIEQLILRNFRSYKGEVTVDFRDLNVLVGKNDIGKSSVLEALDIFFNENKGAVKMDKDDVNKQAREESDTEIQIGVVFGDVPANLTIDATNPTTLEAEFLLNTDGKLEVLKKFPNGGKEKVFVVANHPTNEACADLLLKKQGELKELLTDEIACEDKTKNASIRKAIWGHYADDLQCAEIQIELAKLDAKNTWDQLKRCLPMYVLFQSDRKNSDGDSEVQNPMKLAVEEILKDERLSGILDGVADEVEGKLKEVAAKTLEKLKEMNPEIANSLDPVIPGASSLKWVDVFKNVSITGDEDIPINKRGSGVKRLILLNFFRAEAERRKAEHNVPSIVYAVEEPETSQHPSHQRKLIEAFKELSRAESTQVLLTTHSPAIVKLLEFDHVKLLKSQPRKEVVSVQRGDLPYPSLNEVNFLAFGESDQEYHNELYGFIQSEGWLHDYKQGRSTVLYKKETGNGGAREEHIVESEFIRHQIHHPENQRNARFTDQQLQDSIREMRLFIQAQV